MSFTRGNGNSGKIQPPIGKHSLSILQPEPNYPEVARFPVWDQVRGIHVPNSNLLSGVAFGEYITYACIPEKRELKHSGIDKVSFPYETIIIFGNHQCLWYVSRIKYPYGERKTVIFSRIRCRHILQNICFLERHTQNYPLKSAT